MEESAPKTILLHKAGKNSVIQAECGIPVCFSSVYQKLYSNLQGCLSWTWTVFTKPRRKQKSQVSQNVCQSVLSNSGLFTTGTY